MIAHPLITGDLTLLRVSPRIRHTTGSALVQGPWSGAAWETGATTTEPQPADARHECATCAAAEAG